MCCSPWVRASELLSLIVVLSSTTMLVRVLSYLLLLIFWRPFFFATATPKGTLTDSEFKLATWGAFELVCNRTKPAAVCPLWLQWPLNV